MSGGARKIRDVLSALIRGGQFGSSAGGGCDGEQHGMTTTTAMTPDSNRLRPASVSPNKFLRVGPSLSDAHPRFPCCNAYLALNKLECRRLYKFLSRRFVSPPGGGWQCPCPDSHSNPTKFDFPVLQSHGTTFAIV